ncbi:hypothetical protein J7K27_03640 [Candidatus Bathyarchaeota archaeon]|nr:hypothetical protein [Candidatus Bathyarchaeota archaeon]
MKNDLQRLFKLLDENFRIIKIEFVYDKSKTPQMVANLKLKRNNEEITFSSSQEDCISYLFHLKSIPHIEDDGSDFVYVEDLDKYFKLQEMIVSLLSGEMRELVICERRVGDGKRSIARIVAFEKNWILSEKDIYFGTTKLCQIFYDVGILLIKDNEEKFKLIGKEKLSLNELESILKESQESDIAICFSAFILSPSITSGKKESFDAIIGLIVYDLKNRQTLSLNLNLLRQFRARIDKIGKHGLWECLFDLFERTKCGDSFRSFLPLPLNIRDFTPLPWFYFAFIKGIPDEISIGNIKIDLPLLLVFGTPLLLLKKPSYSFDAKKQVAFVMLGLKEDGEQAYYQVRFDMSKGEPRLHVDVQAYYENKPPRKIVNHYVVNYSDIWDFSENLAIGFLLASVYDVNFDTMVIPKRLNGINESFRKNPLSVYPLFVRSMAAMPFKRVRENRNLLDVLHKIANGEAIRKEAEIKELESIGLVKDGKLTILGDIVHARLIQIEENRKKIGKCELN